MRIDRDNHASGICPWETITYLHEPDKQYLHTSCGYIVQSLGYILDNSFAPYCPFCGVKVYLMKGDTNVNT